MEDKTKLPNVPAKLALDDVESLSHDALKTTLKSIIRQKGPIGGDELMHKNHNSHSNINVMEDRPITQTQ